MPWASKVAPVCKAEEQLAGTGQPLLPAEPSENADGAGQQPGCDSLLLCIGAVNEWLVKDL
jgi:hypothetical protein